MHPLSLQVEALIRAVSRDIVMPRFRNLASSEIMEKSPGDYVTVADQESEAALAKGLAAIFPAAQVIGEEAVAADANILGRINDGHIWVIDPIDGTSNFAAGITPFGIMVALLDDGARAAGWIFDPVADRMCHAAKGLGAFVDGKRVHAVETGAALPVASLATQFMQPTARAEVDARAAGKIALVPIPRCAAEQYPRLVLGQNDVALFSRSHPWDHAAGALFLEEAGGVIRRNDGSDYNVGDGRSGLLAAASPRMWDVAAAVLFS